MTDPVSLWDDPAESNSENSDDESEQPVDTEIETTSTSGENPIAAAIDASSWEREDVELALQVLNLLVLVYFTYHWRQHNE